LYHSCHAVRDEGAQAHDIISGSQLPGNTVDLLPDLGGAYQVRRSVCGNGTGAKILSKSGEFGVKGMSGRHVARWE